MPAKSTPEKGKATSNAAVRRRAAVKTTTSPVKQAVESPRKYKMIVTCAGAKYPLEFDDFEEYRRAKIQFTNRIAKGLPVEAQGHIFIGPMVVQLSP